MLKKFKTKELVFLALSGALSFVVCLAIGLGVIAATGMPMTGGMVAVIFWSFIIVTSSLVIRKFGSTMILILIHMILASPTPSMGPPGVYKILIGLMFAFIIDLILYFGNYSRISYYLALSVSLGIVVILLASFLIILGLPGAEKVNDLLIIIIMIYIVDGLMGTYLARLLYFRKLKNSKLVKQLRG